MVNSDSDINKEVINISMSALATFGGLPGIIVGGGYFLLDAIGAFEGIPMQLNNSSKPFSIQDNTFVPKPKVLR